MKKTAVISVFLVLLISLASCSSESNKSVSPTTGQTIDYDTDNEMMKLDLLLISGAGTDKLFLAGEKENDIYYLQINEQTTVFIDGEKKSVSDLTDGMYITVKTDVIEESLPAFIGNAAITVSSAEQQKHKDYRTLILNVLESLWENDDGLNYDAKKISVDFRNTFTELTDGEKAALVMCFAQKHSALPLTYSFDELVSNGYIRKNELYWEDGILFTVEETGKDKFSASKWRSGDGAIFFTDNKVKWNNDGSVKNIEYGGFAIS